MLTHAQIRGKGLEIEGTARLGLGGRGITTLPHSGTSRERQIGLGAKQAVQVLLRVRGVQNTHAGDRFAGYRLQHAAQLLTDYLVGASF